MTVFQTAAFVGFDPKIGNFARQIHQLWAHSRRDFEKSGRLDGVRCAALRYRRVSRHLLERPRPEVIRSLVATCTGSTRLREPRTTEAPRRIRRARERGGDGVGVWTAIRQLCCTETGVAR
jgi:hypothetical protein